MRSVAPVYVFDLDGTVLEINSFPEWARFLALGRAPAPVPTRLRAAARAAVALARRKALGGSHDALKAALQAAWSRLGAARAASGAALAERLSRRVRPNMAGALARLAASADTLMATAAAAEYAAPLGRRLGFREVLATPEGRAAEGSYVGARKREAALGRLEATGRGGRPIVFFTDHLEDLPLMAASARVLWLGPDAEAPAARAALPEKVELIAARGLSAQALLAAALAPLGVPALGA